MTTDEQEPGNATDAAPPIAPADPPPAPPGPPSWPSGWATRPDGSAISAAPGTVAPAPTGPVPGPPAGGLDPSLPPTAVPQTPPWVGAASVNAMPAASGPVAPVVGRGDPTIRAGGFWRRFWSWSVDAAAITAATAILAVVAVAVTVIVAALTRDARSTELARDIALRWFHQWWWFAGGTAVVALIAWYRLVPRRLALDDATIGMVQLGLVVREASTGRLMRDGRALRRALLSLTLGTVTTAAAVALVWSQLARDDSTSATAPAAPLSHHAFGSMFLAALVFGVVLSATQLLMVVDRRRQTLTDKLSDTLLEVDEDPNWWAVASFGALLAALAAGAPLWWDLAVTTGRRLTHESVTRGFDGVHVHPLSAGLTAALALVAAVTGHVAHLQLRRLSSRRTGRGLARTALVLVYLLTAVGVGGGAALARTGAAPASADDVAARRQLVRSIVPSALTQPPDLRLLAAGPDGRYATTGCQHDVVGIPTAEAEARYTGPGAAATGLPVGLDVWAGSFADTSTITTLDRITGFSARFERCAFRRGATMLPPVGQIGTVDGRRLFTVDLPYEFGSGLHRRTVTLHAAVGTHGHLAVMVVGADQSRVNQMGSDLLKGLPEATS